MRKILLTVTVMASLALGPAGAQEDDLRQRWLRSTPERRAAAQAHLAQRYPQFELKLFQALVGFHQSHPGRAAAAARHLLEDLGGEPVDAALDVFEAATRRYPTLPARLLEWRRPVAGVPPELRTQVLGLLAQDPPVLAEAAGALRSRYRGLGLRALWECSRLADESYPGLRAELAQARQEGQRPLQWLLRQHPDFVREAARRLQVTQGETMRRAAIDLLAEVETRQRARRPEFSQRLLELVQNRYPEAPAQVYTHRAQAARELRSRVRQEFPELPGLVSRTMQSLHPQLLARAAASLERHDPQLRQEVWSALERELPGLRQEVKAYLPALP